MPINMYTHPHLLYLTAPEYKWAMKMGQWHMSHSFACKNQDFDGPFEISMGHLEKNDGHLKLAPIALSSSEGSGESVQMHRLTRAFTARMAKV